jgi:acetyl esterase
MTLHPGAKWVVDAAAAALEMGQTPIEEKTAEQARAFYNDSRAALTPDLPEVGLVENFNIPGPLGDIAVRYYRPSGSSADEILPLCLFYHGGGWVIGDLDSHDYVCRRMANTGGFAIVSVDYRMGPEDVFPAAVNDCYAALEWAAAGAGGRAIDPDRLAVAGDSAGGNLAIVTTILARDTDGPNIRFQGLIYPATDMNMITQSHKDFAEGHILTNKGMVWFQEQYLSSPEDREDWRASPIKSKDLSGLPPAIVITAGHDPLKDEGKAYADRLREAGVEVGFKCYEGQIHGFVTMAKVIDESDVAIDQIANAIKEAI